MTAPVLNWAECNGVALRYELTGTGPRTVVLLHEMGGSLESWDRVMPGLQALGYRVLRFDLRGAGLSEKPRQAMSIDQLRDDLLALTRQLLPSGSFMLAGCAVGAAVAIRFAACHADLVAALLVMAPATGVAAERRDSLLAQADDIERRGVRERLAQRFDVSYPSRYLPDPHERERVRGRLLGVDPYSYAATCRMLCHLDLQQDLARLRCPVVVMAGTSDTTRPPAMVRAVAVAIDGATYLEVDSGHVIAVHAPQQVVAALEQLAGGR